MCRRPWAIVALVVTVMACSDDEAVSSTTLGATDLVPCVEAPPLLLVDGIEAAVAAVEAELGGTQQFFEINANAVAVNVIVADADRTEATPYRVVGEQLSAGESLPAQGSTFGAEAIDIDPSRVLGCVSGELPNSSIELFEIVGTNDGVARYTVFVTSAVGGQLAVGVTGDGQILEVVPL